MQFSNRLFRRQYFLLELIAQNKSMGFVLCAIAQKGKCQVGNNLYAACLRQKLPRCIELLFRDLRLENKIKAGAFEAGAGVGWGGGGWGGWGGGTGEEGKK